MHVFLIRPCFSSCSEYSPDSGASSQAQHHRDEGIQKANLEETRARQRRSFPNCHSHRVRTPNEIPATLERQLGEEGSRRLDCTVHAPVSELAHAPLVEKELVWDRVSCRRVREIDHDGQPIQGLKTARDVTFLALSTAYPLTWTSTGISRNMRRNRRWNLRESVEERNSVLLLGRPLGGQCCPGRRVVSALAGLVFMDLVAAAVELPRPFPFFPFSLGSRFRNRQVRSGKTLPLSIFKNRHGLGGTETEILGFNLLLCLPEGETPHGLRHFVGAGLHTGEPRDPLLQADNRDVLFP